MPPPRGKTKRPRKTKFGRKGPRDMSTLWTNFKVKGSKVKVTGCGSCVNVSLIIRIFVYCLHRVVDKTIDHCIFAILARDGQILKCYSDIDI